MRFTNWILPIALLFCSSFICTETIYSQDSNRVDRLNANRQTEHPNYFHLNQKQETGSPSYQEQQLFDETFMVTMRDGVRLSTTVYKPPVGEPRSVILIRTPYNKEELSDLSLPVLIGGFSLVVQDTRGRFASEGEDVLFQSDGLGELQDGFDTVEWIAGQSWSNGQIGMWGYSAFGITALMAAASAPPQLKCMAVGYAPTKGWGQTSYQGGAFRTALVSEWLVDNNSAHFLPIFKEHPTNDSFWDQYNIEKHFQNIQTPILHVGGIYDCFQQGTLNAFTGIQTGGAEGARGNQQLIFGPWAHVNHLGVKQGELTFPANSIFSEIDELLPWYQFWLNGDDNGVMENPPVTYYVMGDTTASNAPGNVWKTAESWPPDSRKVPFYLQSGDALTLDQPDSNTLSTFILEPQEYVITKGGMNLELAAGPFDQTSIEQREDVLTFTSETLTEPLEIVGNIQAVIYAASSNLADMDISVRVCDVYPDGRSMLLCDGILRASFRHSDTNPTQIQPFEVNRYEIECWATSIILNTGHRLRVSVTHSNTPRFEPNPEYAQLGLSGSPRQNATEIIHSPEHPSHVIIPVVSGLPDDVPVSNWWEY